MKKLTIISIIIIILGGVGYYLYLTDSLNLDFLKKGVVAVEPAPIVENQQEAVGKIEETKTISNQPIHPLCFGSDFHGPEQIDINICNEEQKQYPYKNNPDNDHINFSAEYPPIDEFDRYTGGVGYKILKEDDKIFVIYMIDDHGGTSSVGNILSYKKEDDLLTDKIVVSAHDDGHRGGGIKYSNLTKDGIDFTVGTNGSEFVQITYPDIKNAVNDGWEEYMLVNYHYDFLTRTKKVTSALIYGEVYNNSREDIQCFYNIVKSYILEDQSEATLTPTQINNLNKKFMSTCVEK